MDRTPLFAADPSAGQRVSHCGRLLVAAGALFLAVSLFLSAVAVDTIVESVRVGNTVRALHTVECNITSAEVVPGLGFCGAKSYRAVLRLRKNRDHCFAPTWHVIYEDLDADDAAQQNLGKPPRGVIKGELVAQREAAEVALAKVSTHGLQPCQYDSRHPAQGFWSPKGLLDQSDIFEEIAMGLGFGALLAALVAGASIVFGIRMMRREGHRVRFAGINSDAATPAR